MISLAGGRILAFICFALLLAGWAAGMLFEVGGQAIHLLLLLAVALLILNICRR